MEFDHFSYGWITPIVAFCISLLGSLLGLRCTSHARLAEWPAGWLIAAAVSLGGAGIWVMHFTAMLGFSIPGATIRYDIPMTLLSAAIAVVVVWIGLSIVVRGGRELVSLPIGGAVTGLGVAAMHYLGMFAMKTGMDMQYSLGTVALSIVIAVVAATAALWFMLHVRGLFATVGASTIMGLAVCGMHYTGMYSMHAPHSTHHAAVSPDSGVEPTQLLTPLIVTVTLVLMMLVILVGFAEIDERSTRDERLDREPRDPAMHWPTTDEVRGRRTADQPRSSVNADWSLRDNDRELSRH
ncbi:MHYT domain-containing protein [Nocardia sp. NPDC127579]|uniref:MHYT domain-containing protein n=1 Tax=Nocardia sp. NPDC127579 TaxID=3345402 RepID=UPI00362C645F